MLTPEQQIEAQRAIIHELVNEVAGIRDMLDPIIDGQITRGHSPAGCPNGVLEPGLRKTKLADARNIATAMKRRINHALRAEKVEPEPYYEHFLKK